MSAHRYWRVKCYAVGGHPTSAWNVNQLELADTLNGPDLTVVGGAITASTTFDASHTAAKAIDRDLTAFWSANGFNYGDYLSYDFGSGVTKDIVEVRTTDRTDSNVGYNMTYGELFYSDDNITFTSAGYLGGPVTTVNGQLVVYRLNPVDSTAYRYWKVTATGTGDGNFGCSEFMLASSVGGTNLATTAANATASADDGVDHLANAFDGNVATCYGAAGGLPRFIQYDFGAGNAKNIVEVRLRSRNDGHSNQNLMQGYIEGSNDGTTWTKVAYLANTVSSVNGETKTFPVVPITQEPAHYTGPGGLQHRYWKINATATGNGNFGFAEMAVAQSLGGTNIAGSRYAVTASADDGVDHIASGFDGVLSTCYGAAGGLPRFVTLDFGYGGLYPHIEEVDITSRDGGNYAQNITTGTVQYSDDNVTFTTYWNMSAAAATTNNQVVVFQNSSPPSSRRKQPMCLCS